MTDEITKSLLAFWALDDECKPRGVAVASSDVSDLLDASGAVVALRVDLGRARLPVFVMPIGVERAQIGAMLDRLIGARDASAGAGHDPGDEHDGRGAA